MNADEKSTSPPPSSHPQLASKSPAFTVRARNRHYQVVHWNRFEGLSWEEEGRWTGPFTFVQAADTQLGMIFSFNGPKNRSEWDEEIQLTKQAIRAINAIRPRPRFLVICGDLVDAMPGVSFKTAQVADLRGLLTELHPDILPICVCGNHDLGDIPTAESIEQFSRDFGDDYFSFWVGGVKFLVINSQFYSDDSLVKDLSEAQNKWLDSELRIDENKPRQHLIGFQHIPPFVKKADEARVDVFGSDDLSFNFPFLFHLSVRDRAHSYNGRITGTKR